jgi:hypothetical protein
MAKSTSQLNLSKFSNFSGTTQKNNYIFIDLELFKLIL